MKEYMDIRFRTPIKVRLADILYIGHTVEQLNGYTVWFIDAAKSPVIEEAMLREILEYFGYEIKYSDYRGLDDLICVTDMPYTEYVKISDEASEFLQAETKAGEDWCKANGIYI